MQFGSASLQYANNKKKTWIFDRMEIFTSPYVCIHTRYIEVHKYYIYIYVHIFIVYIRYIYTHTYTHNIEDKENISIWNVKER